MEPRLIGPGLSRTLPKGRRHRLATHIPHPARPLPGEFLKGHSLSSACDALSAAGTGGARVKRRIPVVL